MLSWRVIARPLKGHLTYSVTFSTLKRFHHKELQLFCDVITRDEEEDIAKFLKPILSRKRYEGNHWDDVIQQYKELELGSTYKIPEHIKVIIKKIESKIMDSIGHPADFLSPHVIDLSAEGYIGPHIDSIKFSGGFVSGLSLQSTRIMALTYSTEDADHAPGMHKTQCTTGPASSGSSNTTGTQSQAAVTSNRSENYCLENYTVGSDGLTMECKPIVDRGAQSSDTILPASTMLFHKDSNGTEVLLPSLVEMVLPPRSLYILRGPWRYNYNHAVLGVDQAPKLVAPLPDAPAQRCSIIFRDVKL